MLKRINVYLATVMLGPGHSPNLETIVPPVPQGDGHHQEAGPTHSHGSTPSANQTEPSPALHRGVIKTTKRYRLLEPLGEGGMAIVYVAQDTHLRRTVALKCLKPEHQNNPDLKNRFLKEAQIMASLRHQGVIPIHDMGVLPSGEPYYTMQRVSGQTLESLLEQRSPGQVRTPYLMDRFIDIFRRVCETMAIAHRDGIVHRDLKPGNIMVDDFGTVYVMDWGLAKLVSLADAADNAGSQPAGTVMGTPSYMSPEQARGEEAASNCQSDVFSLGVILYEILTGVQAFRAKTSQDAIQGVLHFHPQEPRKLNRHISNDIAEVCLKALNKDPSLRYPMAAELAQDIRRYREFRPVSATKPHLIDRLRYWSRRHPGHAVLAGMGSIIGIAIALNVGYEAFQLVKTYNSLDALQAEISDLNQRMMITNQRLQQPGIDPGLRAFLTNKLSELEAKRDLDQTIWGWELWSIIRNSYILPKSHAYELAREKFESLVDDYIKTGEVYRARLLVEFLLKSSRNKNMLKLSDDEVKYLEGKMTNIDQQIQMREESLRKNAPWGVSLDETL